MTDDIKEETASPAEPLSPKSLKKKVSFIKKWGHLFFVLLLVLVAVFGFAAETFFFSMRFLQGLLIPTTVAWGLSAVVASCMLITYFISMGLGLIKDYWYKKYNDGADEPDSTNAPEESLSTSAKFLRAAKVFFIALFTFGTAGVIAVPCYLGYADIVRAFSLSPLVFYIVTIGPAICFGILLGCFLFSEASKYLKASDLTIIYPKDDKNFEEQLNDWKIMTYEPYSKLFIFSPSENKWKAYLIKDAEKDIEIQTIDEDSPFWNELTSLNKESLLFYDKKPLRSLLKTKELFEFGNNPVVEKGSQRNLSSASRRSTVSKENDGKLVIFRKGLGWFACLAALVGFAVCNGYLGVGELLLELGVSSVAPLYYAVVALATLVVMIGYVMAAKESGKKIRGIFYPVDENRKRVAESNPPKPSMVIKALMSFTAVLQAVPPILLAQKIVVSLFGLSVSTPVGFILLATMGGFMSIGYVFVYYYMNGKAAQENWAWLIGTAAEEKPPITAAIPNARPIATTATVTVTGADSKVAAAGLQSRNKSGETAFVATGQYPAAPLVANFSPIIASCVASGAAPAPANTLPALTPLQVDGVSPPPTSSSENLSR